MVLIRSSPFNWWPNFLQVTHVHVDAAAIERRQLASQNFLHEIFSFHYLARVAQQCFKQIVFDSGEFNYVSAARTLRVLLSISMSPILIVSRDVVAAFSVGCARLSTARIRVTSSRG